MNDIENSFDVTPSWMYRSGISMVAIVVLCFLALAGIIKYPDVTTTIGQMTSDTPPIEHKSNSVGIVDSIYVGHNSTVHEGDRLISIQTTCLPQHIEIVREFINAFDKIETLNDYTRLKFPSGLHLGELQNEYVSFQVAFTDAVMEISESHSFEKIAILKREIQEIEELNSVMNSQDKLFQKELSLIKSDHNRSGSLRSSNVISEQDMEKADRELIKMEKEIASMETNRIENRIRKASLQLEVKNLESEKFESSNRKLAELKAKASTLRQGIQDWEEKYLIVAKISGRVVFVPGLSKKVKLAENEYVASIVPETELSPQYVRASAPSQGIGEIRLNSKVIIHVDGYPYKQYGSIVSSVESIAPIPKEDKNGNLFYDVKISLPSQIYTNYNIKIPFRPNTRVTAEIVNEEKSILKRIFREFLSLISE